MWGEKSSSKVSVQQAILTVGPLSAGANARCLRGLNGLGKSPISIGRTPRECDSACPDICFQRSI